MVSTCGKQETISREHPVAIGSDLQQECAEENGLVLPDSFSLDIGHRHLYAAAELVNQFVDLFTIDDEGWRHDTHIDDWSDQ